MKKILNFVIITLAVFSFFSCEKASEGLTHITYYPSIEVLGDASVVVQKGSTYTDAGCIATLKGEDVTSQVQVTSTVNTAKSGVYSVNYSITNAEGFAKTASRTVTVLDLTDPIEGFYTTTFVSMKGSTKYNGPWEILIIKNDNGSYYISDFFGGWYAQGRNYGAKYAMTGNFSVSGSTVTYINSYIAGWGDSIDSMEVGTFDAANSSFHWELTYASTLTFVVDIQKNK